jgi:hypothetical protein
MSAQFKGLKTAGGGKPKGGAPSGCVPSRNPARGCIPPLPLPRGSHLHRGKRDTLAIPRIASRFCRPRQSPHGSGPYTHIRRRYASCGGTVPRSFYIIRGIPLLWAQAPTRSKIFQCPKKVFTRQFISPSRPYLPCLGAEASRPSRPASSHRRGPCLPIRKSSRRDRLVRAFRACSALPSKLEILHFRPFKANSNPWSTDARSKP